MDYDSQVIEYFDNPINLMPDGELPPGGVRGGAGERAAGCRVDFAAVIEGDVITDLRFLAYGCPHTIAACCLATERLKGRELAAIEEFEPAELMRALEIPPEKAGKMLLLQDALQAVARAAARES